MFEKLYPKLQIFKKKYAGLYFNANGATYIKASDQPSGLDFSIEKIGIIDNANEKSFLEAQQLLASRSLVVTLAKSDYILMKIEKPACKEKEMAHEILWAIQDQLPFDTEDTIIRWFDSPLSSMQTNFIFALAINNHYFAQRLTFLKNLHCKVIDITIPELANAAILLKEAPKDCGIVYLDILDNDQTIMVVKNGLLMASKRISKNFSSEIMPSPENITSLNNTIQQVLLPLNIGTQYKIILFSNDRIAASISSQFHALLNIEITCFPKSAYIQQKIDNIEQTLAPLSPLQKQEPKVTNKILQIEKPCNVPILPAPLDLSRSRDDKVGITIKPKVTDNVDDDILFHNGLIALGGIYAHVQAH